MQQLVQKTKKILSLCLITLLVFTSAITFLPAPAQALGDININCEKDCGDTIQFAAGMAAGSAVTLSATGQAGLITEAAAVVGTALTTATTVVTGAVTLGSVVVPAAAMALGAGASFIGYNAYKFLTNNDDKKEAKASN